MEEPSTQLRESSDRIESIPRLLHRQPWPTSKKLGTKQRSNKGTPRKTATHERTSDSRRLRNHSANRRSRSNQEWRNVEELRSSGKHLWPSARRTMVLHTKKTPQAWAADVVQIRKDFRRPQNPSKMAATFAANWNRMGRPGRSNARRPASTTPNNAWCLEHTSIKTGSLAAPCREIQQTKAVLKTRSD
jgi:hypothetical protein